MACDTYTCLYTWLFSVGVSVGVCELQGRTDAFYLAVSAVLCMCLLPNSLLSKLIQLVLMTLLQWLIHSKQQLPTLGIAFMKHPVTGIAGSMLMPTYQLKTPLA